VSRSSPPPTLFGPRQRASSIVEPATTGLPPDLVNRAAARLQILAWLYAAFFLAAFFPNLLFPDGRRICCIHMSGTARRCFVQTLSKRPDLSGHRLSDRRSWPGAGQVDAHPRGEGIAAY
jgi:hypothetical protein